MKISKHLKLTLAIAGGFFLCKLIISLNKRKQTRPEENYAKFSGKEISKPVTEPITIPTPPIVTTPVSGTSHSILEGLDENAAEQLKQELTGK